MIADRWQSIETAPKDGTAVLLWLASDIDRYYVAENRAARICIGFFGASESFFGTQNTWCSVEAKEEMWGMGGEMTGPMTATECITVDPTHWMPLPEPPQSGDRGADPKSSGSVT
jgi:hypothetical protein